MKERNKAVPAVYVFLERDGKFLLMRRANTGYEDGNYQNPAGHVDAGELPIEAAIREAKEEVGVDIQKEDIELVHVTYRTKKDETGDRIDFFFKTCVWTGEITNKEPEKCDELMWVSPDALPPNTVEHIKHVVAGIQKGVLFSEIP